MLLLDGYGSHTTYEGFDYCWQNYIIPFRLPEHSTHLLQPIHVTCFQLLKHYHRQAINDAVRSGQDIFDRREFLAKFKTIRERAFKPSTLRHAFRHVGIDPLDPTVVLNKIPIEELDDTDSDSSTFEEQEEDIVVTPQSMKQFLRRAEWLRQGHRWR